MLQSRWIRTPCGARPEYLKGTHDFKSFEASDGGTPRETTVRTIYDISVTGDRNIEIHVSGDGFLYNMVRIITGTLTDIGRERSRRNR